VARAGRPDPTERLDAVSFAAALQAVAPELPAPEKLALAGLVAFDENHLAAMAGDPTDLGSVPAGNGRATAPAPPAPTAAPVADPEATRITPTPLLADPAPTAVIAVPEVPKPPKARRERRAEQAEVTAVLVSRKAGRRKRWPWVVLLVIALLGAGGAGAVLLAGDPVPSHPLPDVTTKDRATAEGMLRALKFDVGFDERYIDATPVGIVTEQSPKAGTGTDGKPLTLKEGKHVTLVVSKGPPPTAVPDLTGMTETQAVAAIKAVGHLLGDTTRPYDEDVPAGQVMTWTHKGESPPKGVSVDLTVSAGPAPRVVPSLAGLTYDQAVAALDAKGLKASRAPDQYNEDDSTAGKVVAASPSQGSTAKRGDTITLSVSKGRPEVPALVGLSVDDAKAKLAAVGLTIGGTYGPGGGKVFLATPSAGTKVKPGSSVDVFIL
jgi:serine/threonine-protein kinase